VAVAVRVHPGVDVECGPVRLHLRAERAERVRLAKAVGRASLPIVPATRAGDDSRGARWWIEESGLSLGELYSIAVGLGAS